MKLIYIQECIRPRHTAPGTTWKHTIGPIEALESRRNSFHVKLAYMSARWPTWTGLHVIARYPPKDLPAHHRGGRVNSQITDSLVRLYAISGEGFGLRTTLGPSIKYVTLFLAIFDPPSPVTPCHRFRDPPKYVTRLGPPSDL